MKKNKRAIFIGYRLLLNLMTYVLYGTAIEGFSQTRRILPFISSENQFSIPKKPISVGKSNRKSLKRSIFAASDIGRKNRINSRTSKILSIIKKTSLSEGLLKKKNTGVTVEPSMIESVVKNKIREQENMRRSNLIDARIPWNNTASNIKLSDLFSVRLANVADDKDIANLRFMVFFNATSKKYKTSDYFVDENLNHNPYRFFCERSREVLNYRRKRGAICLVVSVPLDLRNAIHWSQSSKIQVKNISENEWVIGTLEC